LNRIDDIVCFGPLAEGQLARVLEIQLSALRTRLEEREITLVLTDDAVLELTREGYDPVYGARPMKRVVQRRLENPLASSILEGNLGSGETVEVAMDAEQIVLRKVVGNERLSLESVVH
jgi:ATP-dependent Clp protease ATP-binding subunit ClpB